MPHSRHRHKHPAHQQQHSITPKPKRSAATIMTIIIGIFGLLIGAISSESNFLWMALGAVVGSFVGWLVGKSMDKTAAKK